MFGAPGLQSGSITVWTRFLTTINLKRWAGLELGSLSLISFQFSCISSIFSLIFLDFQMDVFERFPLEFRIGREAFYFIRVWIVCIGGSACEVNDLDHSMYLRSNACQKASGPLDLQNIRLLSWLGWDDSDLLKRGIFLEVEQLEERVEIKASLSLSHTHTTHRFLLPSNRFGNESGTMVVSSMDEGLRMWGDWRCVVFGWTQC